MPGKGVVISRIAIGVLAAVAAVLLGPHERPSSAVAARGTARLVGIAEGRLARLHPVTLRPLARGVRVPRVAAWAASPAEGRVAVASGRRVLVADARRLRVLRTVRLAEPVQALTWPTQRRLVAVSAARITTIDPLRGRVTASEPGHGRPVRVASAGGTAVLAYGDRVSVARGAGPFRVVGLGTRGIGTVALAPNGRTVVVFAGSRASRIDTEKLAASDAHVSLPGEVVDADWSGAHVAVAVERAGANGREPGGAYLVDPLTWRVRTVDSEARGVSVTPRRVLTFGHVSSPSPRDPELYRMEGIGIRGYDTAGRRRFHVLGRVAVSDVLARGRYAYVQVWARAWLAVVDLERGSLARRTVGARTTLFVK